MGELLLVFEFVLGRIVINTLLKVKIVIGDVIFGEFLQLLLTIQGNSIKVPKKVAIV